MLNMRVKGEGMSAKECWQRFGWGTEAKEGSAVLYYDLGDVEVFCDEMREEYNYIDGACFGCEIYDKSGDMVGQWFDDSYESAILGAFVDSVGTDVLREEDNCEDAVNGIAYEAYQAIHGETPMFMMDVEEMSKLIALARNYVKDNGKFYGIEWEEF